MKEWNLTLLSSAIAAVFAYVVCLIWKGIFGA